jgi:F-type H+-transporting ATPase subunit b
MPQLDRVTFVSQIFWCLLTFSSLYFILLKKTLPQIAKVLKLRKKKNRFL